MRTWNDYKEHVKSVDPEIGKDMDEVENISAIVSAMVEQRTSLGLSQRELASMCGIAQSSVARIESCKTVPSLDTLLNIFRHLGLQLTVTPTKSTIYFFRESHLRFPFYILYNFCQYFNLCNGVKRCKKNLHTLLNKPQ